MVKKSESREKRYISEYLLGAFPEGGYRTNVELGPIEAESIEKFGLTGAAKLLRSWRRRIDAVVWRENGYYLIEAKIRDPFEGLGRLHTYLTLAKVTPDLPHYAGQPFIKRLVVPQALPWIRAAAEEDNVELVEYWQDWIAGYVKEIQGYYTSAYRRERYERLKIREILGVE